jgi:membrane dipeptidase
MSKTLTVRAGAILALVALSSSPSGQSDISDRVRALHQRALVIDTHADTTQRLISGRPFDIGRRNPDGSVDIPRLREGGVDALFFSIWTPGSTTGPAAVTRAREQIEAVRSAIRAHSDEFVFATSAAEIRRASADGKIAALLGLEGGHMIDGSLETLADLAKRGVRYLTLTHSRNTPWADSSGDEAVHDGLTPFGREVVAALNGLGVMVDVSHVADATFYDVLEVTRAPVIASHSSCRAISNSPRNLTDDMLRALAKNGGVVMINFHAPFLSEELRTAPRDADLRAEARAASQECAGDEACSILASQRVDQSAMRDGRLPAVSWEKIIEHIDHAVKVAGVDHVGLGSDFDGATMPLGMEDASSLPRITAALLERGYADADVRKILGENLLRVMEAVERASTEVSTR